MALNIRNAEAERLAEAVAKLTGETKTEAVTRALRDRLRRLLRVCDGANPWRTLAVQGNRLQSDRPRNGFVDFVS
jgi:hypothetical protein